MKRTALEIYALAVCFVCVFAIVSQAAEAIYALVQLKVPQTTLRRDFEVKATNSNDSYWKWVNPTSEKQERVRPAEDELTKRRLDLRAEILADESNAGIGKMVNALLYLVGFVFAFATHWYIAKKARSGVPTNVA